MTITVKNERAITIRRLRAVNAELLTALELAHKCIAYCRRAHPDVQTGTGVPVEFFIDAAIAKARE